MRSTATCWGLGQNTVGFLPTSTTATICLTVIVLREFLWRWPRQWAITNRPFWHRLGRCLSIQGMTSIRHKIAHIRHWQSLGGFARLPYEFQESILSLMRHRMSGMMLNDAEQDGCQVPNDVKLGWNWGYRSPILAVLQCTVILPWVSHWSVDADKCYSCTSFDIFDTRTVCTKSFLLEFVRAPVSRTNLIWCTILFLVPNEIRTKYSDYPLAVLPEVWFSVFARKHRFCVFRFLQSSPSIWLKCRHTFQIDIFRSLMDSTTRKTCEPVITGCRDAIRMATCRSWKCVLVLVKSILSVSRWILVISSC